ncbi:MAG: hypothetical protein ACFCU6_05255 [Balneolaceae bacterium]
MSFDGFDDDFIWNEYQWEKHLNEIEKKSEQLRRFITSDPKGNTPRWMLLLQENVDELDAVEAFIEEELLLDEAYFPDEDEWDEEDDDELDDDFFFYEDEFSLFDDFDYEDDEDFEYGEEWKSLSEEFTHSDYGSIENMSLFNDARDYAVDVLKWAEYVSPKHHNKAYHEFINNILKIGAKLAGGFSFGFEQDVLGGNIAYTKKALYSANDGLKELQKLKHESYMTPSVYKQFHSRLFELRNDIGVYVQEMRDRFDLGLE